MKELDVLLERFARNGFPALASTERAAFEGFLELPDPLLARYLLAGEVPDDPTLARLARLIASRAAD
jgi:antitoxin CptB